MARESRTIADEIAHRVRELRTERGWSQAQLAAEMAALGFGWSRMTVTEVEGQRRRAVAVEELLGLAHVYDVGVSRILGAGLAVPPHSDTPPLLSVTPSWIIDRHDARSLLNSGRRPSGQEAVLEAQLRDLTTERERLADYAKTLEERAAWVDEEIGQVRRQLGAARAKAQVGKGRKR